jgi:hypothetical protein
MIAEASKSSSRYSHDREIDRHCEPTGRANAPDDRLCEAIDLTPFEGVDRFVAVAPRHDGEKLQWRFPMTVTVFIRYQLDPFKRAQFEEYSRRWHSIIPRCGGDLIGYWMPHEGTNNIAFALISFEGLGAYEAYRARLRGDAEGVANFNFAEENKFILCEERTFLRKVTA